MADNAVATTESGSRLDPWKQLTQNPATRQLVLLVAVAAAVALGVAVVLWSRGPNYGLLYAGLDQKDASAIAQELQATHAQYKLGADGTSIMAPMADLAALRLQLAARGLPQGSAAMNSTDAANSPFGMSDLAERTRNQERLEADLSATIGGLQSIRAARVHLALPKPSAFIRDSRPASASVLVSLYQGRKLDAGQVAAIVHLVAASVPELDAREVSVVDQQGQLLTPDPNSADAIDDSRLRITTRMENTYAQRIEDILTPLVGQGRVRAQVYADVDFSQSEKATETFNPDKPALRSEQVSSEHRAAGGVDGGVPGALSNQPPVAVPQATAANPNAAKVAAGKPAAAASTATVAQGDSSSSATRNYELDRTISHVRDPAGRLARLTVAVVLDDKLVTTPATTVNGKAEAATQKSVPFTADELAHLTALTKNAVGFDAARGDSVSVVNQSFQPGPNIQALPELPLWQRPGVLDLVKQGLGVGLALLVAFGLLRPVLKGLLRSDSRQLALAGAGPMPTIQVRTEDVPGEQPAQAQLASTAPAMQATLNYEKRVESARRMVGENSKQVAQVVKNWVNEDAG